MTTPQILTIVSAWVFCIRKPGPMSCMLLLIAPLVARCYQHCRLVTFSAGLHQVMKLNKVKEDEVFFAGVSHPPSRSSRRSVPTDMSRSYRQCLHAGSAIINCVIERILPTGFLRYSPEHVFALSAFATAVLMKVSPFYTRSLGVAGIWIMSGVR